MSQVFVFGSNREGRHGKGAALEARERYGAQYGVAEGPTGNAYAIITKELRRDHPPVTLREIALGVEKFILYAKAHPEKQFLVTPIGTGLAGFIHAQIAPLFRDAPTNCQLPDVWKELLDELR